MAPVILTGRSTISGFDLSWFRSLSSGRLRVFGLVLYAQLFLVTSFYLPFSELSLVRLALELVN